MGCITPYTIKNPHAPGTVAVPCGRCPGCRDARAAAWAFRLLQEDKVQPISRFITLTYNDDHVKGSEYGLLNLDKEDLKKFFYRLRKYSPLRIKYYACGEYGGKTKRPHYHAIVFGAPDSAITQAWSLKKKPIGDVHFGDANIKTMYYVTKYLCKPRTVGLTDDDDRQREFAVMSKNLGASYLTPQVKKYHLQNLYSFVTLPGGIKQALPRYYRDKIFPQPVREIMNERSQRDMDLAYRKAILEDPLYAQNRDASIKEAFKLFHNQRYITRDKI